MRAGRIIALVFGVLLGLVGFGVIAGGAALIVIHTTQRDGSGYYQSPVQRLDTSTAALVTHLDMGAPGTAGWPEHPLGTVRVTVRSATGNPVFVGLGPTTEVDQWLAGSAYARVVQLNWGPVSSRTETVAGDRPLSPPGAQPFWVGSVSGTGEQVLTWPSEWGGWAIVIANVDGSSAVVADVSVASNTGLFLPVGLILLAIGAVLAGGAVAVGVMTMRGSAQDPPVDAPASLPGAYPVRLEGRLEPGLSRWLWLVKWALAIPHYLVLVLLWLALVPLTAFAGVAILITGQYPRTIFDFNVGVMRWTWRVSFYTFSALATDRYPPFSLRSDPSYPADLVVDYPQRLSRGLVLIKWWLLAIPHYLIVGLFVSGGVALGWGRHLWWSVPGGGLIGLLALVAAMILLFTGAYPLALFNVVVGLNRWCYRVFAYVALMRDEYPPFRLDLGGPDPGTPTPVRPLPRPPDTGSPVEVGSGTSVLR